MAMSKVVRKSKDHNVFFKAIPSLRDIISGHLRKDELFGFPLIEIFPELLTPFQSFLKRSIDISISVTILILMSPVMLLSAIIVKLESPGGIIYSQMRTGKDFKEFRIYKFRSMSQNAEAGTGAVWATKNDPRVTKFGLFMRKTRIDELPQLFNILIGNMSFVGPRPERKVFNDQFMETIPYYYKRFHVKPGLTGWSQVKYGYGGTYEDVVEKLKFDLFYIENMSLQLDLIITLNTVSVVLKGSGQ